MLSLPNLTETYYTSIFTSGLKEEIKSMVTIIEPTTLVKAFEVALLQETTITAINKGSKPYKPYSLNKLTQSNAETIEISYKTNPHIESNPKNPIHPLKFKAITPSNFQTKRKPGLCYKCDEKYTRDHMCKIEC